MAKAVRDIDRGFGRIMKGLVELKGKEIAVGLQSGKKTKDGKMDMARLGAIHEFGAVIDREARMQTTFHKINSKGKFMRGGKFVKAKRSNFARDVSVDAHSVVIPERSFMRSTYDEKNGKWKVSAWNQIGLIVDGKTTAKSAMNTLGEEMQGDIQRKIVDGPFVPNAPSTIRKKKSARPLIDSARMRQSIRYVIRRRGSGKVEK